MSKIERGEYRRRILAKLKEDYPCSVRFSDLEQAVKPAFVIRPNISVIINQLITEGLIIREKANNNCNASYYRLVVISCPLID